MARVRTSQSGPEAEKALDTSARQPGQRLVAPGFALLLCMICAVVYFPVLSASFLSHDDNLHVYENPYLRSITAGNVGQFWRHPYQGLYVPVSYTVFALLALVPHAAPSPGAVGAASGLTPGVFHAASLLLHMANVLLVFGLLRRLVRNDLGAAAGALLFGVHPLQVESVGWISEMRGLLATLFGLAALRLHILSPVPSPQRGGENGWRRMVGMEVAAALLFALSLLAKPSTACLPLVAWAIDAWVVRRPARTFGPPLGVWAGLAIAILFVTRSAQPPPAEIEIPVASRLVVAGDALAFYTGKLLWPVSLGLDYGQTPSVVLHARLSAAYAVVALAAIAVLAYVGWRFRTWFAACALFVAALLPVLGLVPFQYQVFSTVADRYAYLAMLGPALGLSWIVAALAGGWGTVQGRMRPFRLVGAGATLVVLVICGLLSSVQVLYWQNDRSLFTQALAVNPGSWVAETGLGVALSNSGDLPGALQHLTRATMLKPEYPEAWYNLGNVRESTGDFPGAVSAYQRATALDPGNVNAWCNLGLGYEKQARYGDAVGAYRAAIAIEPGLGLAHQQLGVNLLSLRETAEGTSELETAVRLDPGLRIARERLSGLGVR